ncbi:MAG: nitric oxide reductase transcriptional regulator NorR [Proteobacteria bacterium]|nr:nitric oxide reductase transcriptional regulator NorR [Pseudomonadota bacterium]
MTLGQKKTSALVKIAADLTASLPTRARYQRLIEAVRLVVPCDAAALLRYQNDTLVPVADIGLSRDVRGRTFVPADHPRMATILASRAPVRFEADDGQPDPFDGLLDVGAREWSRIHSCMGCSLYVGDELVGALTMDAADADAFDEVEEADLALLVALAAAAMRTAGLIESLEELAERRGEVAQTLVVDALKRHGGELLGQSPAMARLQSELQVVSESDLTVLISGETGTGKELVARTVHARSRRADQPLVYVNCAALPESIAESELFGHRKGAFTGAVADRAGKFEIANDGTLFLDEIGELPLSVQPKLLRALQAGEIQRVGADHNSRVDVRIVAATNRDLAYEVKEGHFRADLYHRLSVYPVQVPPLRDRYSDVPLLSGRFLDVARVKLDLGPARLTKSAIARLERYPWPGNVRELEHVIMRAALRASGGRHGEEVVIDARHLDLGDEAMRSAQSISGPVDSSRGEVQSFNEMVTSFKRDLIARTITAANGNLAEAARQLKMDRGNLFRMAERLGLK